MFVATAKEMGLVDASFLGGKQLLRDTIRLLPEGEIKWQKLQGQVYGAGMIWAQLIDGVDAFLRRCQVTGHRVFIVSHKTEYGHYDPDRINLRKAAVDWMTAQGFFRADAYGISAGDVYFESTRNEKLDRIGSLECSMFIDDLEEVLLDPNFPRGVRRILFGKSGNRLLDVVQCTNWNEISEVVFRDLD